jgi:hypothetical protein
MFKYGPKVARRVPMRAKNDRALAEAIETCKQKLQMLNV